MVVLVEEFHSLTLKRKGAGEPEMFDAGCDDRSGFALSCRATKMRRLACPDGFHGDAPAVVSVVTSTTGQDDVPMGDAPLPAGAAGGEEERAIVVYGDGPSDAAVSAPRLRPCAPLRAGADWVIRAMLREADSQTLRELLSGDREQGADLALAVVPWVAPSPEDAEPSTPPEAADGGDSEGASAMDVEEDEDQGRQWTGHTYGGAGAGCGEGFVYRWPPHCMPPQQLPLVGQASPVMWSW